jgi:hypothetical protein
VRQVQRDPGARVGLGGESPAQRAIAADDRFGARCRRPLAEQVDARVQAGGAEPLRDGDRVGDVAAGHVAARRPPRPRLTAGDRSDGALECRAGRKREERASLEPRGGHAAEPNP